MFVRYAVWVGIAVALASCAEAQGPGSGSDGADPPAADAANGGGPVCGDNACDVARGECDSCPADCSATCGGGPAVDAAPMSVADARPSAPDARPITPDAEPLGSIDAGGGDTCAHSPCEIGGPLVSTCSPCVELICSLDFYCCLVEWDVSCSNAVSSTCSESCP